MELLAVGFRSPPAEEVVSGARQRAKDILLASVTERELAF